MSGLRRPGVEFFRGAVEHGHDPLALVAPDGQLIYASPEALAMLGLTRAVHDQDGHPQDVTPVSLIEHMHLDDREALRQLLTRVSATPGRADFLECRAMRPHRRVRWVEVACRNLMNDPDVGGMVVHLRDITARHALEEALQRTRQTLEEVQSFTHFGIWSSGFGEPRSLEWSSEIYRIFGVIPERFDGRWETFLSMVHPDDRALVREAVEVARRGEAPYQVEHRIVRPDGGTRWVHQQGEVVRNQAGRPLRLVGVVRDITETRRAEESRRESERRFRALIENSEDGILLLNRDGDVLYASPAAGRLVGRVADGLVNMSLFDLIMADDHEPLGNTLREVLGSPSSHRAELRVFVDKRVRILETVWSDHLQDRGLYAVIVNARDVTSNRELAEQLQQASKMEAVGRLAGGIAHDFNNQLTVILGVCAEALRTLRAGDALHEALADIQEASQRASTLTQQLLAYGRRQMLVPKLLDLNDLVTNLEKMLRRLIGEDVVLATELTPQLGMVRADPGQLEQVIVNLVVNARDALPQGGGHITIVTDHVTLDEGETRAPSALTPGAYVQLAITDTGIGMSPDVQARVFDPFFTTKPQGKGTGLGLSTVYGIIRQSGGDVTVESTRGQGSTFRILLPRERRRTLTPGQKAVVPPLPRGNETILVVEDEPAVRRLVSRLLRDLGYQVYDAEGGREALALMETLDAEVHLVLSDVVMPGMSGPEMGQQLHGRFPQLRFLYMSGYTDEAILQRGLQIQGSAFIGKPFAPEELARKVREVLGG